MPAKPTEQTAAHDQRNYRAAAFAIALFAFGLRSWVAVSSHFTAEDYLITLRYAENIAHGAGFVFNPGERVLGTTTPLYTLFLALVVWLHGDALNAGKAVNILADSATCYLLACVFAHRVLRQPAVGLFAALFYALSPLSLKTTGGGMETGLVTCACVGIVLAYLSKSAVGVGVLGAVLYLLRIDSLPLFALLAVGLAVRQKRVPIRELGLALLIALPWTLFACLYFGSPIPNTIAAKILVYGQMGHVEMLSNLPKFMGEFWGPKQRILTLFAALGLLRVLHDAPVWSHSLRSAKKVEGSPERTANRPDNPAGTAARPGSPERNGERPAGESNAGILLLPVCWMLFYYGTLLFSHVPAFYWYFLPPYPLYVGLAMLGAGWVIGAITSRMAALNRLPRHGVWSAGLALLFLANVRHLADFRGPAAQMQATEDTQRVPMSLWLGEHVLRQERILLEPIGYVGYYSHRRLLDMIGLVSPEVLPSYRTPAPLADIVRRFQPEWICLREPEMKHLMAQDASLLPERYTLERTFGLPDGSHPYLLYHIRTRLRT